MEATQKKNKYEIDMCNGTIMDKLISFALPLMVSSILQLLFNAVDIIVVGRFTGSQALAAVGSTTALINMFVNLFIGVSLGANVLSARFYAAGKEREMSETVHTAMTFALISGIVMVFVGLFCTRGALELMDTPADVIDQAALYMKIYFCSMPFFMLATTPRPSAGRLARASPPAQRRTHSLPTANAPALKPSRFCSATLRPRRSPCRSWCPASLTPIPFLATRFPR